MLDLLSDPAVWASLATPALLDPVFALDSVLAPIGMAGHIEVVIAAVAFATGMAVLNLVVRKRRRAATVKADS